MQLGILLQYIVIFLTSLITKIDAQKRVCFYSGWAIQRDGEKALSPEKIDAFMCTHLVISYGVINRNGTGLLTPDYISEYNIFDRMLELRKQNDDLNLMLSIGGWDHNSVAFSKMVKTEKTRQRWVDELIPYLRSYDFDGVDIDWMYPGTRGSQPEDQIKFYKLLRLIQWEFAQEFTPDDKWNMDLSISVFPRPDMAKHFYHTIPKYAKYVSWINMKMFDMHGHWDNDMRAVHHAPLYSNDNNDQFNVNDLARYWVKEKVPRQKIVLGISCLGRSFKLANQNTNAPGSKAIDGGAYPIKDICKFVQNGQREIIDPNQGVPHLVVRDEWIGYDNAESTEQKAAIVKHNGLGGVMVWQIDQDDFSGGCGKKYPIMMAVLDGLGAMASYRRAIAGSQSAARRRKALLNERYRSRAEGWSQTDAELKIKFLPDDLITP